MLSYALNFLTLSNVIFDIPPEFNCVTLAGVSSCRNPTELLNCVREKVDVLDFDIENEVLLDFGRILLIKVDDC
tara:strand:+ start:2486 stop:2707 length:222 start_codon:yes stop_codon:yes gene_type:complete